MFCDFFNWVNLSEISVGEDSWGLILGTVSKIKNLKQRAAFIGPLLQLLLGHNFISSISATNALVRKVSLLTF